MATIPENMEGLVSHPHGVFRVRAFGGHAVFIAAIDSAKEWAVVQLLPWDDGSPVVWCGVPIMKKVKVAKIKPVLDAAGKHLEIVKQPAVVAAMVRAPSPFFRRCLSFPARSALLLASH